jgi:hypothetical protein
VIVLSMSLISQSTSSSLCGQPLDQLGGTGLAGQRDVLLVGQRHPVAAVLVISAGQAWFSTRWAVTSSGIVTLFRSFRMPAVSAITRASLVSVFPSPRKAPAWC